MGTKVTAPSEQKAFRLIGMKTLDGAMGLFEGYLSVFGNEDETGDIVERGAFTKTLRDAHEVKNRNNSPLLYPLLWMHDPNNPIGGIMDASEDTQGLYIKGQCDLETEMGRRAFSGMQKGYMSQMSIGYDTVKATRDSKGVRHLIEVRLWEGSAVTTGFAANTRANVTQTKANGHIPGPADHKGASGKSSWPIASRERGWDAGAAHNRIVAWATNADDTLDVAKMRSVHFWVDDANAENITGYKLLFCDIIGGDVQAIPRGIFAVAAVLSGARGGADITDASGVRTKVAGYYRRMAREFSDDAISAPWESGKLAWRRAVEDKQMGGLATMTAAVHGIDYLLEHTDTLLGVLTDATGLTLDSVLEAASDDSVGSQLANSGEQKAATLPGVHPAIQIMLDSLPGLTEAFFNLSQATRTAMDAVGDVKAILGFQGLGPEAIYEQAAPVLDAKVGRTLSAATQSKLMGIASDLQGHADTLHVMCNNLAANDQENQQQQGGKTVQTPIDITTRKPELRATTSQSDTPEPGNPPSRTDDVDDTTLEDQLYQHKLAREVWLASQSLDGK